MSLSTFVLNLILGRPLANRESAERKVSAFEGLPATGLDGLGSSAYGPEAALTVLIPLGTAGLAQIGLVMLPILVLLTILYGYYAELDRQLREGAPIDLRQLDPPIVLVATEGWNRLTDRALRFALRSSPDVVAVHFLSLGGPDVDEKRQALRRQWAENVEKPAKQAGLRPPQLVLLEAPYRRIAESLLQFARATGKDQPDRLLAVLIPEVIKEH